MPPARADSPAPLLGRWLPTEGGGIAWVATVDRDGALAWLIGHGRKISAAAALVPRLEARMLGAVDGADDFEIVIEAEAPTVLEVDIDVSFTAGADPDAALRSEFAAVRAFAEGRLAALKLKDLDTLGALWQRARLDAGDVFDQAGALLQGGPIETHTAAGRRIATTMTDWSGDLSTAWLPRLDAWEVALHRENVALALRAREAALDGIAAAARGAARLAALIAAPAPTAAAMTLPIAWRYLRRLWHGSA
jgi:hypothetical protein